MLYNPLLLMHGPHLAYVVRSVSLRRSLPYHVKQAEITSWNILVGAALYKQTFTQFGHELFLG